MKLARLLGYCLRLEWLLRRGVPCSDRMQLRLESLQDRLSRLPGVPPTCARPHWVLLQVLQRYRDACDDGEGEQEVEYLRRLALSQVRLLQDQAARGASGPPLWLWRVVSGAL